MKQAGWICAITSAILGATAVNAADPGYDRVSGRAHASRSEVIAPHGMAARVQTSRGAVADHTVNAAPIAHLDLHQAAQGRWPVKFGIQALSHKPRSPRFNDLTDSHHYPPKAILTFHVSCFTFAA